MKLQRSLIALATLMLAGTATAQSSTDPGEGDVALFLSNISALPMYNVGYFFNDDVMGYGSLAYTNDDNDSGIALGLGARIYGAPGTSEHIRTYWNAGLHHAGEGFYRADGGLASFGALGGQMTETLTLSADFGAEAELAPRLTIGAEVGLQWMDTETTTPAGNTNSNSILSLGTADLTVNYYF